MTILIDVEGSKTRELIIYFEATIEEMNMDDAAYSIFKWYMTEEEAKRYWKGLSELTEFFKVIVNTCRIVWSDFSKDKKNREATRKYIK